MCGGPAVPNVSASDSDAADTGSASSVPGPMMRTPSLWAAIAWVASVSRLKPNCDMASSISVVIVGGGPAGLAAAIRPLLEGGKRLAYGARDQRRRTVVGAQPRLPRRGVNRLLGGMRQSAAAQGLA